MLEGGCQMGFLNRSKQTEAARSRAGASSATAEVLATFGRYECLGPERAGITDREAFELTRGLRERRYRGDEAGVLADVRSAASVGG